MEATVKALRRVSLILYVLLLGLMALPWLPVVASSWLADNLANFQPLWVLCALPVMALQWFVFRHYFGLLLVPVIALVMVNFSDRVWPRGEPEPGEQHFRLVQFNASYWNPEAPEAVRQLRSSNADFIALQEVGRPTVKTILRQELTDRYPYSASSFNTKKKLYGLDLYSRFPIVNVETFPVKSTGGNQILEVDIQLSPLPQPPMQIYVVHPHSPRTEVWWTRRNQMLIKLAELVRGSSNNHLVVVGDMNVSPWSPWFHHFVNASGLEPCAALGTLPTWSALDTDGHWRWLAGSDIDHCFFRASRLAPHRRRTIEAIGSDHRAVATEFEVYPILPGNK